MIDVNIKSTSARKMLEKLASRIEDKTPVWKSFLNYWKTDIMPKTWDTKGKVMGESWPAWIPPYKGGKRMMELTGRLFQAVRGGGGWSEKVTKNNCSFGVSGYEYFHHVQERGTNPRWYFMTRNRDLPNRAYGFLIKEMDRYLEEADG